MANEPDYCPVGGVPCQALCATPCGSRKPLTPQQVKTLLDDSGYGYPDTPHEERAAFITGIRHAESMHGITGITRIDAALGAVAREGEG